MSHLKLIILFISTAFLATGCSYLKKHTPSKRLVLQKKWVSSTLRSEYLGSSVLHRFEPLAYKDLIIQGNGIDGVSAYTKASGELVWSLPIKNGVEAGAVIDNDVLYFAANDGYFYAVKAVNGKIFWNFPIRSEGVGAPAVKNGSVYFIAGNNVAYSLDAKTGRINWPYKKTDTSNISIRGASTPLVKNGKVYMGFNDGYLVALDAKTGKAQWQKLLNNNRRFKDVDARPVIDGVNLYVSSFGGSLFSLKANTGDVNWVLAEGGYSAVTVVGDKLLYSTTSGYIMSLDKASGKVLWKHKVNKGHGTQPKHYKGFVVYGESSGKLFLLDFRTGKKVKSFSPGRGVTSSALVEKNGDIFFISRDANLFALTIKRIEKKNIWNWEQN